jgi:predicted RNA binding protein YcfA (HicA-like mRNA interferase family)
VTEYSYNSWNQIRNFTPLQIIKALKKDGWIADRDSSAPYAYFKIVDSHINPLRIVIHFHPKKHYSEKVLKKLLDDIGWSEDDLKRLKVIK